MLALKNISYSYSTENVIFKCLNLVVNEGEFVVITGKNGCGKSTLFNIISGASRPQIGTVEVDGRDVTNWSEHKRASFISKVWQDTTKGSIAAMTIFENMSLAYMRGKQRSLRQFNSKKNRSIFVEQLSQLNMGLEKMLDRQVASLSGGQRQAVSVAMAYTSQSKLILLDEITAALDKKSSEFIMEFVIASSKNKATLMVSHNESHKSLAGRSIDLDALKNI